MLGLKWKPSKLPPPIAHLTPRPNAPFNALQWKSILLHEAALSVIPNVCFTLALFFLLCMLVVGPLEKKAKKVSSLSR